MPVFEYAAYDSSGRRRAGIIDAESEQAARERLRGQGLFAYELRAGRPAARSFRLAGGRVRRDEVWSLTRQLATLVDAGIPLSTALETVQRQSLSPRLHRVVAEIKERVREGESFSRALAAHPRLFSPVFVSMARAAEASGALGPVLDRLADLGERQQELRGKLLAAAVYPLFMAVIGAGILAALLAFVVPDITAMFTEMRATLPWPTRALMAASSVVRRFWPVILVAPALFFFAWRWARRQQRFLLWSDAMLLRLPFVGPLAHQLLLARFARTAAGLLASGVGLPLCLRIVRNIGNNAAVAAALDRAATAVEEGGSLAAALDAEPWFPPMLVQLIAAGEHGGRLAAMLAKAADAYERGVEARLAALTALFEPVMIVFMGGVVGFIVLAILLPIFEMQRFIR